MILNLLFLYKGKGENEELKKLKGINKKIQEECDYLKKQIKNYIKSLKMNKIKIENYLSEKANLEIEILDLKKKISSLENQSLQDNENINPNIQSKVILFILLFEKQDMSRGCL